MSGLEDGRLPDGTGLSQAEPKVSALRASIPDADAEVIEYHADEILRASGSRLAYYTMPATREGILAAVVEAYNEGYQAGASGAFAMARLAQGTSAGTVKTEGLGAKPAGPVAKPCAPMDAT